MHAPHIDTLDLGKVTLRSGLWKAERPSGKRPIVFCNGIGANLELSYPFAENVFDRDVLTFDAPGVGGSTTPAVPYRLWRLAGWLRRLTKSYGFDEFDLVGVSWGGALAQQMAFQYPRVVKKAVFAATTPGVIMVPGKLKSLSKMLHFKRYSQPEFMKKHFETLYGEELGERGEKYAVLLKPPSVRGYTYQLMALMGWSSLPFLPLLKQRTMVIMGDRDTVVPPVNGKIISGFANRSKLRIVKDGGHLFLVTKAEDVVPHILKFLDDR